MTSNNADEHKQIVREQFTKQAIPFSLMADHSPELILGTAEVGPEDTVLDIACGPGLMSCALAAVARDVTGLDLTPAMVERAKALQVAQGRTNVSWLVGDVLPLPFPAASFSLVFCRYSFHHFLDPMAVLREMARVCSPTGRVVVVDVFTSTPEQAAAYNQMEKLRDPSHVRALSLEELAALFEQAGVRDVKSAFYKHEFELEQALQGSFPNPGDADRVRQIFTDDLAHNRLGLGVCRRDGQIHFAYPIVILVGRM